MLTDVLWSATEACQFGAHACVQELLLAGAELIADAAGMSPRDLAVRNGHDVIVDLIDNAPQTKRTQPVSGPRPASPIEPQQEQCQAGVEPVPVAVVLENLDARADSAEGGRRPAAVVDSPSRSPSPTSAAAAAVVRDKSPLGLERKLREAQHLIEIASPGVIEGRAQNLHSGEARMPPAAAEVSGAAPAAAATQTQAARRTDGVQGEEAVERTTEAEAANTAAASEASAARAAAEERLTAAAAAETAAAKAAEVIAAAEDPRNAIAEANEHAAIAVPPPPLLSEFEWQSGQQPPPLEPPPLSTDDGDGDGDDPNDPMATIRRLANQYRSKHHHRHVAARHDAALHN